MNEYIKIHRGIHVGTINDQILKKLIEYIGRTCNHTKGILQSDSARGRAYLSRKCNMSKNAIKNLYRVKTCPNAGKEYGDSYSNVVRINIEHFAEFFNVLINELKNKDIDVLRITGRIHNGIYDERDEYMTFLFEETEFWMDWATRDENFAAFNLSNEADDVLDSMLNECNHMNEIIGE